ncbi:MAG: O-antigen ligase family protein [Methylococcaceae bacterium]|nr:O-antigen ligase family protein [Methylococcaceae bacterium]
MNHLLLSIPLATKNYYANLSVAVTLIIYICLTPTVDCFFYDGKRIAEISLIVLAFISLSASKAAQTRLIHSVSILNKKTLCLLSIILVLGLISSIFAPSPRYALIEVLTFFSLFIVALLCAPIWRHLHTLLPWIGLALLASFAIQEVKFLSYYGAFLISKSEFDFYDFFFTFSHPRFFNQYQIWTLPLLTLLLRMDHPLQKVNRYRVLLWIIAIIWWGMLFTTNGRGALTGVIGSYIVTYAIFRHKAKDFLNTTLLLMFWGFIFYQILFHLIPYFRADNTLQLLNINNNPLQIRSTSSGRLTDLWPTALQMIQKNPWLGIGPMHFQAWNGSEILAHPHNSLLQLGAEWGLPALLAILLLIYTTLSTWVRRFNVHTLNSEHKNFNLALIGLTFSLSSAFILSLFSGVIVMPMSHLMGILVASLAFSLYQPLPPQVVEIRKNQHWLMTLIFAIFAISYFWLLSPELMPRLIDPTFSPENPLGINGPRFWLVTNVF